MQLKLAKIIAIKQLNDYDRTQGPTLSRWNDFMIISSIRLSETQSLDSTYLFELGPTNFSFNQNLDIKKKLKPLKGDFTFQNHFTIFR